ncbi:MAG: cell division protein FtsL [Pseudomonadota bacterium]|nr:cell division protein FtsL [Pseudomonadota bacterium]
MRFLSAFLISGLLGLAYGIYQIKYDTRDLDGQVAELRRAIQQERDSVAILRAEWSHLNRPERVERLARKHLGLEPLKSQQIVSMEQLASLRRNTPAGAAAKPLGKDDAPVARRPASLVH